MGRRHILLVQNDPNRMHPSLRVKGVQGKKRIYEMTVTMDIRAAFEYIDDGVLFRNIGSHDETIKNA